MVRQAAFTGKAPLLKGALHCHTTRSDGKGAPDEVIRLHKQNGYDFMALTDHRVYNLENYAPDTDMIIIPGMEIDRNIMGRPGVHCFHTVVIGDPATTPFTQDQRFSFEMAANQYDFQNTLDHFHANEQMTLYCHPEWSNTPAREFDQLRGNFAMEIWNTGCALENDLDTNAAYWDELLTQGKRLYGVATDDGHAMHQHCKGWVRVNAEKNAQSVLAALKNGAFYSSCGPELFNFTVENGVAVVECSPCVSIAFHNGSYPLKHTKDDAGKLTRAETKIPEYLDYVRVTVVDAQGNRAWSNPIFLDGRAD